MSKNTCSECGINEINRPLAEAGAAANKIMLKGSSERLRHMLDEHDLGSGIADCGCTVFDYAFYPCKEHTRK